MTEINEVYQLRHSIKGWPVKDAGTIKEATEIIFGSPYWDIPEDVYKIVDKNETYSLLAIVNDEKLSKENRYLVVNMAFTDHSIHDFS